MRVFEWQFGDVAIDIAKHEYALRRENRMARTGCMPYGTEETSLTALRLYRPDEDDDNDQCSDDALRLDGTARYAVYRSYTAEFIDSDGLVKGIEKSSKSAFRFWRGFAGGGVLESSDPPTKNPWSLATFDLHLCHVERIRELTQGNDVGKQLAGRVAYAIPDLPPPSVVKLGLAKKPPKEPTVAVSAEHLENLYGKRYCMAVPKKNSKVRKCVDSVPEWFASFGIEAEACPLPDEVREQIAGWFDRSLESILFFRVSGGEADAAWQVTVTAYIASHWWTQWRGLQAVHLLAEIEGKPVFRPNWRNPMYR